MILKKLKLNPFAGITDRTIDFSPGLNIFHGRNEAGKSTMVRSILALLFVKPSAGKRDKELFKDYIPVGGGDTIKAELEFSVNNADYVLSKYWGGTNKTELKQPDGTLITKYEDVEEKINEFLHLKRLTYENVLFVNQTKLTSTINDINSSDIKSDITQILRTALFETGGISIEKFKELIAEKETEYFNSWDIAAKKPKGSRDFNNPWLKNVGLVLSSYYKYRGLENELKIIEEYELKIDEFNTGISEITVKLNELNNFITGNKKAYEDSSKRELVENKIKTNTSETNKIKEAEKNWPKIESDLGHQNDTLLTQHSNIKELEGKKTLALEYEGKKHLADKYEKIDKLNTSLDENNKLLNSLTKVTSEDVKKCSNIKSKIDGFYIKLEAQKLNAKISAKTNLTGNISLGMEEAKAVNLQSGESSEEVASGRFIFENESLKIEVSSGNENIEDIIKNLKISESKLADLLSSFKAASIDELISMSEKYKTQLDIINNLKSRIDDELGSDTLENLGIIYKEIQNTKIQKTSNELGGDITKLSIETAMLSEKIRINNEVIAKYVEEYNNRDSLIDRLVDLKSEGHVLNKELSGFSPLPEGFSDSGEFIENYKDSVVNYDDLKDELSDKRHAKTEFEKNDPKKTEKDVTEELQDAKKEFEKRIEEGEAILLIKSMIDSTLASVESDTYKPLKSNWMNLVQNL